MSEYRNVVVPWGFSKTCPLALERALQLVAPHGEVHVVHVETAVEGPENGMLFQHTWNCKRRELSADFFRLLPASLEDRRIRFEVESGDLAHEIANFCDRLQADLVVVPEDKKTLLARLGLANPAEKISRAVPCKVIQVSVAGATAPASRESNPQKQLVNATSAGQM